MPSEPTAPPTLAPLPTCLQRNPTTPAGKWNREWSPLHIVPCYTLLDALVAALGVRVIASERPTDCVSLWTPGLPPETLARIEAAFPAPAGSRHYYRCAAWVQEAFDRFDLRATVFALEAHMHTQCLVVSGLWVPAHSVSRVIVAPLPAR